MLRKDAFLSLYFLGIYTALSRLVDGTLIKWIFFKKLLTMTPLKFILLHKCAECARALSGQTVHVGSASKLFPIRKPLGNCKFTTEMQNLR